VLALDIGDDRTAALDLAGIGGALEGEAEGGRPLCTDIAASRFEAVRSLAKRSGVGFLQCCHDASNRLWSIFEIDAQEALPESGLLLWRSRSGSSLGVVRGGCGVGCGRRLKLTTAVERLGGRLRGRAGSGGETGKALLEQSESLGNRGLRIGGWCARGGARVGFVSCEG
jgi:hypothetical protein